MRPVLSSIRCSAPGRISLGAWRTYFGWEQHREPRLGKELVSARLHWPWEETFYVQRQSLRRSRVPDGQRLAEQLLQSCITRMMLGRRQ